MTRIYLEIYKHCSIPGISLLLAGLMSSSESNGSRIDMGLGLSALSTQLSKLPISTVVIGLVGDTGGECMSISSLIGF